MDAWDSKMGPAPLPRCRHGRQDFENCQECRQDNKQIREQLKPLADEFWKQRGRRDIEDLLYRAYRMGMRHESI